MKHTIIAPSILAADFANLQRDIEMINQSDADWFHIDIMDGVFVPNISFGMPVLKAINKHANKTIDVHLMIVDPDRYIKKIWMKNNMLSRRNIFSKKKIINKNKTFQKNN